MNAIRSLLHTLELYVERKRSSKWVPVDPPPKTFFAMNVESPAALETLAQSFEKDPVPTKACPWRVRRSHVMYGMLAGISWLEWDVKPPTGLPRNVSAQVLKCFEDRLGFLYGTTTYQLNELLLISQLARQQPHYVAKEWEEGLTSIKKLVDGMDLVRSKYGLDAHNVRTILWFT